MLRENVSAELLNVLLYKEKKRRRYTEARDFSALSMRLSGESVFHTAEGSLSAPVGSIAFVPSGQGYDRTVSGEETIAVFHFAMLASSGGLIETFTPQDPAPYRALFLEAIRLWEEKPKGYRYDATAVFYRILSQMERDGALFSKSEGGLAARAAEYLERNFRDRALTVSALAAQHYVSEAYLRRRFRERYGMSPKQYLEAIRVRHAISLLSTGYYTQTEIADRCGYSDVKYFRTAFKVKTGYTLSEYLKKNPM